MRICLLCAGFLAAVVLLATASAAVTGLAALPASLTPTDIIHLPAVFKDWPSDRTPTPTPSSTPGPCATPTPDYFQHPPAGWVPLGASTTADFQQCYGYGDLDADGRSEMVGSYSHSAVGVFLHRQSGSLWNMSVLHPKFDPALNHVKGMQGGWPVKGLVTGDFESTLATMCKPPQECIGECLLCRV
jgi:hypothetical protein